MKNRSLSQLCNEAIQRPLVVDEVDGLSLNAKCALIRDIIAVLKEKKPQSLRGTARHTRQTLTMLVDVLEPSQNLLDLQNRKKGELLLAFSAPEYDRARFTISNWRQGSSLEDKKRSLIDVAQLQERVYTSGIVDALQIEHEFLSDLTNINDRFNQRRLGGFSEDYKAGRGLIRQSHDNDAGFDLPERALEVACHEMTHGIQFCLAYAYHHNKMSPNHPLYDDAKMFNIIHQRNAYVPPNVLKCTEQDAYYLQPQEKLAFEQGRSISAALIDLSHS